MLVDMPLTAVNRNLLPPIFWASYKGGLKAACAENEAKYLDLSADKLFDNSDFVDTVHLNAGGGIKLIDKIADTVSQDAALRTCLNQRPVTAHRSIAGRVSSANSGRLTGSASRAGAGL
jgi:hypothetical protein